MSFCNIQSNTCVEALEAKVGFPLGETAFGVCN